MSLSTFIYGGSFVLLYLIPNTKNPTQTHYTAIIVFLCSMSFGFAVYYTCLSASIPYLSDRESLGTAWGICGSVGAFAQSVVPIINSRIINSSNFIA